MKTFAAPISVFRVGRAGSSLELAPWTLAPFNGRFDDPAQEYRVRYLGVSRRGAFVERLARYRPDLDALAAINDVEADSPVFVPSLPLRWLGENEVATAAVDVPSDNGIVDLTTGEGIAQAHVAIEAARRRTGRVLRDYDASVLLSATPREFTQAISRYLFESGFAGIAYRSRFAPEEICVALFERRHTLHDTSVATIAPDDADLADALGVHHLGFASEAKEERQLVVVSAQNEDSPPEMQPPPAPHASSTSFREQIHELVYRVRELVATAGLHPSDNDEANVTLAFGKMGLADEVHDVKLRIRNFTGHQQPDMATLSKMIPIGTAQLLQVANLLERLANCVPLEARSTPAPSRESGDVDEEHRDDD